MYKKYILGLFLLAIPVTGYTLHDNLYHIEILVFSNNSNNSNLSGNLYNENNFDSEFEKIPTFAGKLNLSNALQLKDKNELGGLARNEKVNLDLPILLDKQDRKLNNQAHQLRTKLGKKIIFHSAWKQKLILGKRTLPIYIEGGDSLEESEFSKIKELEGLIDFKKLRGFYHANVDFIYKDKGNKELEGMRLKSYGRIKKNDVFYFDHPKFGILLLLTEKE